MTMDAYPARATHAELQLHVVQLEGTGASAPTVVEGKGITVTRNGAGSYRLSFADNPGSFVALAYGLQAATPGDMAGHTAVGDEYVAPSGTTDGYIDVIVYDSAFAADDLEADEYLNLFIAFARTGA